MDPLVTIKTACVVLAANTFAQNVNERQCFPHKSTHCLLGEKHRARLGNAGSVSVSRTLSHRYVQGNGAEEGPGLCLQPEPSYVAAGSTASSLRDRAWREAIFKGTYLTNNQINKQTHFIFTALLGS